MACTFSSLEARGVVLPDDLDHPIRIDVTGVVTTDGGDPPCTEVKVSLTHEGVPGSVQVNAPVNADGSWLVSFIEGTHYEVSGIRCNTVGKIEASCAAGVECGTFDVPMNPLSCEPADCPDEATLVLLGAAGDPVDESAFPDGCVPPGTYQLHATAPAGSLYAWGIVGGAFDSPPGNAAVSPSFDVADETVSVSVSVVASGVAGCLVQGLRQFEPCEPEPPPCPDEVKTTVLDAAGDPVDLEALPDGCLPAGTYRMRVDDPVGAGVHYGWSIDGASFDAAPADDATSPSFTVADGDDVLSVSVGVSIDGVAGCILSGGETFEPCPLEVDCLDELQIELLGADEDECLPPGRYVVRVVKPEDTSGLSFDWSRDGQPIETSLDPAAYPIDGPELLVEIDSDEELTISVATLAGDDCTIVSDAIDLEGCPCPPGFDLVVVDAEGERVDTSECLPPGRYMAHADPASQASGYVWTRNGQEVEDEDGPSLGFSLAPGGTAEIVAEIPETDDCPREQARVRVEACPCPDAPVLSVRDASGAPVVGCVTPGIYTVRIDGEDVEGENVTWTVPGPNGSTTVQDATQVAVTVTAQDGVGCNLNIPAGPVVTATVAYDREDCPDATVSRQLAMCPSVRFSPCCWIMRLLILLLAVIAMIGLALWICPQVVYSPLIPETANLVPIAEMVAPFVFFIAAALALVLIAVMVFFCRPTWCNDWMVLLWQFLVGGGFVFVYFGACPTCPLLIPGLFVMALGVLVFFVWIRTCRPSPCKIFFEIGNLGLVQVFVGWIEFLLVVCIWVWGWLLQLVFTTILNALGWIGSIVACRVNPNA